MPSQFNLLLAVTKRGQPTFQYGHRPIDASLPVMSISRTAVRDCVSLPVRYLSPGPKAWIAEFPRQIGHAQAAAVVLEVILDRLTECIVLEEAPLLVLVLPEPVDELTVRGCLHS